MISSDIKEQQEEEREVLQSIYDGDVAFKQINPVTFQYKYGEDDELKSFLLELEWTENYPNEPPKINLGAFYNRNLVDSVKLKINSILQEEAEQWLGSGMTYTLFECLKDKLIEILADQPDKLDNLSSTTTITTENIEKQQQSQQPAQQKKKEILTKSQKRRQWEHSDHKGDKPRGYNWVDIVKHLSQTGVKDECGARPTDYQS